MKGILGVHRTLVNENRVEVVLPMIFYQELVSVRCFRLSFSGYVLSIEIVCYREA